MPMTTEAAALFKEAFDIYDLQHETKKSKEKRDGTRARQKFLCRLYFPPGRKANYPHATDPVRHLCAQARSTRPIWAT